MSEFGGVDVARQPYYFANGLMIRNSICAAPIDRQWGLVNGAVSRWDCDFHRQHARYVGLDIVGSAYVSTRGCTARGSLSVAGDDMISGLQRLTTTIHQQGARAILQLVHAGQRAIAVMPDDQWVARGPSSSKTPPTHALSVAQLAMIIEQFGQATRRAMAAGFDGVEIHGANHFLLQQFMSPLTNRRTDSYGGSLVNRLRLPIQIVRRVLQEAQSSQRPFVVGYRLSPEERLTGGLELSDQLFLMRCLVTLPVDCLSLSLHHYWQLPLTLKSPRPTAVLANRFIPQVPLMVAGKVVSRRDLNQLADWQIELVGVGRALLRDPQ